MNIGVLIGFGCLAIFLVILIIASWYDRHRNPITEEINVVVKEYKPKNPRLSLAIDKIIELVDNHYMKHSEESDNKTNYNIVAILRILKVKYNTIEDADEDYYWKQLTYAVNETMNNAELRDQANDIILYIDNDNEVSEDILNQDGT